MRKGEKTRQHIVQTAARVLNRHGYAGSGMAQLMDETGLTKGGLYRHFDSKEALAVEAFDYAFATVHQLRFANLDEIPNAVDKLKTYIERYATVESPIPGGCAIMNTGTENDDGNPVLLERARKAFDMTVERIAKTIEDGKRRGEIRREVVAKDLALFLFCSLEGGILASRLHGSRTRLKVVTRFLIEFLEDKVRQLQPISNLSPRFGQTTSSL